MRRRLPAVPVHGDADQIIEDIERGVADERGNGLCLNKRCVLRNQPQALCESTGCCQACCVKFVSWPGDCPCWGDDDDDEWDT